MPATGGRELDLNAEDELVDRRKQGNQPGQRAPEVNLYQVLHVHPRARPEQIRNAFRRVALKLHPDRNPSPEATSRFLRAVNAFKILSDPKKRSIYDRSLARARSLRSAGSGLIRNQLVLAPKMPGKPRNSAIDALAVFLAVLLPVLVGAAEAMGYSKALYGLVILFVVAVARVFRLG